MHQTHLDAPFECVLVHFLQVPHCCVRSRRAHRQHSVWLFTDLFAAFVPDLLIAQSYSMTGQTVRLAYWAFWLGCFSLTQLTAAISKPSSGAHLPCFQTLDLYQKLVLALSKVCWYLLLRLQVKTRLIFSLSVS